MHNRILLLFYFPSSFTQEWINYKKNTSHKLCYFSSIIIYLVFFTFTQSEGYDPTKSRVSDSTMETWKTTPTVPELSSVPGLGEAGIAKLANCEMEDDRITNTYQLFGKFLMMKGPGDGDEIEIPSTEHTEKFWYWLKNRGIHAHRSAIVRAIAEKSSTFFQGIYDVNDYDDEE